MSYERFIVHACRKQACSQTDGWVLMGLFEREPCTPMKIGPALMSCCSHQQALSPRHPLSLWFYWCFTAAGMKVRLCATLRTRFIYLFLFSPSSWTRLCFIEEFLWKFGVKRSVCPRLSCMMVFVALIVTELNQ